MTSFSKSTTGSPFPAIGALLLCGGGSRRMGRDKASLPFGPQECGPQEFGRPQATSPPTMLGYIAHRVAQVVLPENILCVAAADQALPPLPAGIGIVRDRHPNRGPLEGLAVGLAALESQTEVALVTTCDAPLLVPALIGLLAAHLGERDAVVPQIGQQRYPLTALYRTSVYRQAEQLLDQQRRRVLDLLDAISVQYLGQEAIAAVDPQLHSLRSCNTYEEYQQLLGSM